MSIKIPPFMYVLSIVLSQNFTMFCIIFYVLAMQSLVYVACTFDISRLQSPFRSKYSFF